MAQRSPSSPASLRARYRKGPEAANTVIAYEPVWAIGTGLTPTPADIAEVHGFIRGELGRLIGEGGSGAAAHTLRRFGEAG